MRMRVYNVETVEETVETRRGKERGKGGETADRVWKLAEYT